MLSACLRSSRLILGDIDPGNRQQRHGGADVSDLATLSEATVGSGVTTGSLMLVVRDFDGANWKDDVTKELLYPNVAMDDKVRCV